MIHMYQQSGRGERVTGAGDERAAGPGAAAGGSVRGRGTRSCGRVRGREDADADAAGAVLLLSGPFLEGARRRGEPDRAALYAEARDARDRFRAARAVIRSLVLTTFTRKAAARCRRGCTGILIR